MEDNLLHNVCWNLIIFVYNLSLRYNPDLKNCKIYLKIKIVVQLVDIYIRIYIYNTILIMKSMLRSIIKCSI